MHLSESDHALVAEAVTRAEQATDGEIVTIVAARSDKYGDVATHWALLAMLSLLAAFVIWPTLPEWLYLQVSGDWSSSVAARSLYEVVLLTAALVFVVAWALLRWAPLRMALTPPPTKARRVHRAALSLFRATVERRTRAATGVLLYVSLAEHRAELVAEAAIHSRVDQEVWGEAMNALVSQIRDGRPGQGIADAVAQVGIVLAEHFPRGANDTNELPDRVIEL
ncbi:TPM domain-containing protein [Sphingomonas aerophila]|jgi:putative membrane protein|uniref:Putative membrane protein n=1 Tax=Sphingomonas aerophila TaxID=1344948 RepID=A0A7W9EUY0_9SPHN|nr:hypothetical protein [Sphingomonas aerophila]MBB5715640.1 putative membrane protein [Sphingomonas aerophila]